MFSSGTSFSHSTKNINTVHDFVQYKGRNIAALCLHFSWKYKYDSIISITFVFGEFTSVNVRTNWEEGEKKNRAWVQLFQAFLVKRCSSLKQTTSSRRLNRAFCLWMLPCTYWSSPGWNPTAAHCRSLEVFGFNFWHDT